MTPSLLNRLRERGYRLTAQRRVVAEVLEGENVHLTADKVHLAAMAHHLAWDGCGLVLDVQHGMEAPALRAADRHGMDITSAEIVYHGRCPARSA